MLEILIIADCPYTVILHGTNEIIEATDERLLPVRERDGRCVMTGVINPDPDIDDFEAAHIFPNLFMNGLLMRAQIHQHFNGFRFSINVDDNYKIISFDSGIERMDGRTLDPICRAPNDEWMLANMRGAGESIFEFDFPPGTDIVGDILRGPKSAQRMEPEHFTRLWPYSMNDEDNIDEISH
ncbi:hypothetical protein V1520DRAFT_378085 [Lipomyces starkeyi]